MINEFTTLLFSAVVALLGIKILFDGFDDDDGDDGDGGLMQPVYDPAL